MHTILNNIEDVLSIQNLSENYKHRTKVLVDKIQFYERRGLYTHEKYTEALLKARNLMIELQTKSDYIHFNDF